ncbi:MAG: leucyl aminopeptidase [Jatrophihabitantaceae bacterium]
MTSVHLIDAANPTASDVVIIATVSTDSGVARVAGSQLLDPSLDAVLDQALRALDASGKAEQICRIPTLGHGPVGLVVAVGLGRGSADRPAPAAVRRAVGAALRSIDSASRVTIAIGDGTDPELVGAICDGALLGSYRFTRYKSASSPAALKRINIAVTDPSDRAAKAAIRRSQVISTAINNTRDLVNTPANDLNPVTFADYAKLQGEAAGLTVEVMDERALRRGSYGGILAVGSGSATPPRMVRLSYRPTRARGSVALVGKGITFDTGGLDIKTSMMAVMKSDMGGAAAVVEAVIAAAKLKLPVAVTATVPMAENAVSGTSFRPSDVLTLHDGRTVEVDNTDAEGRLILADAMLRACEDGPDYLIETSTLTGGQLVALGEHTAAAMGSEDFRDRVVAAGARVGESLWPMPLTDDLRPRLNSTIADITNLPKERWGSMLVAGSFLAEFVAEGVQWVHLDIAGPSFAGSASGYTPTGGTGFIVATIVSMLSELAAS